MFFLASAGASSAYLTVSEIFPMETRALSIAFFYAVGTAAGGIAGPLLFGHLINTGDAEPGRDRLLHRRRRDGDRRHRRAALRRQRRAESLEDIAEPLTAEEAEREAAAAGGAAPEEGAPEEGAPEVGEEVRPGMRPALEARRDAEEQRARAAEHRAVVHRLKPRADAGDHDAAVRLRVEEVLAQMAEWEAERLTEEAAAHDERLAAEDAASDGERRGALERAAAAEERARSLRGAHRHHRRERGGHRPSRGPGRRRGRACAGPRAARDGGGRPDAGRRAGGRRGGDREPPGGDVRRVGADARGTGARP